MYITNKTPTQSTTQSEVGACFPAFRVRDERSAEVQGKILHERIGQWRFRAMEVQGNILQ